MPPRNNPLPAAVRLFNCTICDKGYPRQVDYENHLRSYDHNHRQRLADMKKLTASNADPESQKPKQGLDMRSINVEEAGRKMGAGGRFTKIGSGGAAGKGFKKVGVVVGEKKEEVVVPKSEEKAVVAEAAVEKSVEGKKEEEDTAMADRDEEEVVTWEEYDFTKPTGCDHASCPGCKTDGIWSGEWVAV
ncbi:hypothetical protein HBI81_009180 [Parastagonospora nodorum]|nr:hypothetical protein HBI95_103650 [Parastagonospora nodorum]KAH5284542.1 hypothetical protein HBI70_059150 [Parastagonospora nodorum]KAH5366587.1 hypothetical protein HBI49_098460 [Parastagonospora nodorum]KAH5600916.1 hypothetical protein HBI45_142370 [Parastagonospora nodorum]KAH5672100.1 hypothetical protein HBI23_063530 [Parastagonospora nodorum]